MKKLYTLFALATLTSSLIAQSVENSKIQSVKKTMPSSQSRSGDRLLGPDTLGLVNFTDFWPQFAPSGGPVLYTYVDGGYVYGNNVDNINICAQGYMNLNHTPVRVMGVLIWFGAKESDAGSLPTSKVVVKSWGVSPNYAYNTLGAGMPFNQTVLNWPGPDAVPTLPNASADLLFANIDTLNYTYVPFPVPPAYAGDFALGVDFTTLAPGDTAGIVSDLNYDAYELDYAFHHFMNKWMVSDQLFSATGTGGLDANIAIWAVVDTALCYTHYTTTYDTTLNTFSITVDPTVTSYATSYHWDFGDGTTSNLIAPTHTYAVDSLYNVCLKVFTAAGDSCEYCHTIGIDAAGNIIRTGGFTLQVIPPMTVSAPDAMDKNTMTIYPNPFTSEAIVSFSNQQTNTTIILTEILGKEIRSDVFSGKEYVIEKGDLKPGIYLIRTIDAQKQIRNSKIIIQ